ncbi:hypothetical protein [Candidatus Chloroploca asiatica]|uniref:NIPSNAP domain-containing protein n=1 Tax=Candidatus Chloroploca asiatica TaxID=1506545 RepID=A0A2H3KNX7_9CHLR|nr:hypothetical protein [Candidatus Chloroploca asiatica]PDV99896.1 hypothetical protein A9Q02_01400 [Candidatus Chloroploca asiatica]
MQLADLLTDIHALEESILIFERKYGVRSETFYAAYISGEEPDDEHWVLDFSEWASVYQTWLARQAAYRNEVQRLQRGTASLSGLIRVAV